MDVKNSETWSETFEGNIIHRSDINRTVILAGEKIDSLESFFRVFGEAVNGPNGYFGRNEVAFVDCLSGRFGISRPFTIRWENCARSRLALNHSQQVKIVQHLLDKKFYFEVGDEDQVALIHLLEKAKQGQGRTAFDTLIADIQLYDDIRLELID